MDYFGTYFFANEAIKSYTGKSIGEHIGEALNDPVAQQGWIYETQFPDF